MSKRLPTDIEASLNQCDDWIRGGQSALARRRIRNINFRKVPRHLLHRFCGLARRTQQWSLSLRALQPVLRPNVRDSVAAFPNEKIEYALALWRIGAFNEAETLLADPKLKDEPRVLLARAHGHLHRWDYSRALVVLSQFIKSPGISEYEKIIAEVNRLACLSFLSDKSFLSEFERLETRLEQGRFSLLRANALEIKAQWQMMSHELSSAHATLKVARKLIEMENGLSTFLIDKWDRINQALMSGSPNNLNVLRKQALAIGNWESIRDIDFFHTMLDPNCRWANMAYYGTPYRSFRLRLEDLRKFPDQQWVSLTSTATRKMDPWFIDTGDGSLVHRLLVLMLSDMYRPVTPGEIFAVIHPGEYFNIEVAFTRVRQLIRRTKMWIKKQKLPVRIEEKQGFYSMRMEPNALVLCRRRVLPVEKSAFFFARFTNHYDEALASPQWAKILDKSGEQTRRILIQAAAEGVVAKFGKGQFTTYSITSEGHARDPVSK